MNNQLNVQNNFYIEHMKQLEKENYIADMLVRTLYSNHVNEDECFRIIDLFKDKITRFNERNDIY